MILDFWFDFSSPYAYLASTQIEGIASRTGATLRWRPMLLGAVFKEVGQVQVPLLAASEAKQRHYGVDIVRWAAWWDVPFRFPAAFPIRSLLPLRTFLAQPDPAFARAVFHAAWAKERDITDPAVLRACGASAEALEAAPTMKQALIDQTGQAVAAGVFGAPTCIVDDTWLFWGQDRLDMVEKCLGGWVPPA
ncbi:MAG: 2-hydroxychromene-2-carboxylate isomerase [Pseudomonadota bacterium]|nr:2-hydroxychromene-2-carboxylate isomerase [Pseudomonadota bacterium]